LLDYHPYPARLIDFLITADLQFQGIPMEEEGIRIEEAS
jgi:hypothetical protein